MYQIVLLRSDGTTAMIYDQNQINLYPTIGPKASMELNEAGSLSFTILPGHPLYDELMPLSSFVKVLDDGEEIFYGRVLQRSHPTLTGQVSFQCEGALTFLLDSEVEPDQKGSSGSSQGRIMTAEAFFRWCIDQHNAEVNDSRRQFTVGVVNANKRTKEETFVVNTYTQTKSIIESSILNVFGGFIRVRPDGNNGHYIDWVQTYDNRNPQEIVVGTNLEEQTNQFDSNQLFTVIRPVGNDNVMLTEKTIDLYSQEYINLYGRIVKTIDFKAANTEAELRAAANEYVSDMKKTLFINSSIRLVDMHYLNGTIPKVHLGDIFTNIHGLNGIDMTVYSIEFDFEHVENTTLELKNPKSLDPDLTPEGNMHAGGKISRSHGKSSQMALKYYKEYEDMATITVPKLSMTVNELDIGVKNYFRETASSFERFSSRADAIEELANTTQREVNDIDDEIGRITYDVTTLYGTDVIQNSQFISNLVGHFEVWHGSDGSTQLHLLDGAELAVDDKNGGIITVGQLKEKDGEFEEKNREFEQEVTAQGAVIDTLTGSALWTQRDNITGIVGEFDIENVREWDEEAGQYVIKRRLVVKSGGGMVINENGVEYGIYHNGNLDGGMMVQMIDNQTTTTINGQRIRLGAANTLEVHVTAQELAEFGLVDENGNLTGGMLVQKLKDGTTHASITSDLLDMSSVVTVLGDTDIPNLDVRVLDVSMELTASDIEANGIYADTIVGHRLYVGGSEIDDPGYEVKIYDATKTNDILTIYKTDGTTITFSKAASVDYLTGTWSGADSKKLLTITTVPSTSTPPYRIGFNSTAYDVNLNATGNGDAVISNFSTGTLRQPIKVYYNDTQAPYASHTVYEANALVTVPLTTGTFSSSGTYTTEGTDYLGYSKVVVRIPTTTLSGAWSGGTYTVNASPGSAMTRISLGTQQASWPSDKTVSVPIMSTRLSDGVQESTGYSAVVDTSRSWNAGGKTAKFTHNTVTSVPSGFTATTMTSDKIYRFLGQYVNAAGNDTSATYAHYFKVPAGGTSSTTLSATWSSGTYTVTASPQNVKLRNAIYGAAPSWNANKKNVTNKIYSQNLSTGNTVSTGLTISINTAESWNAGGNTAYVSNHTTFSKTASEVTSHTQNTVSLPYGRAYRVYARYKKTTGGPDSTDNDDTSTNATKYWQALRYYIPTVSVHWPSNENMAWDPNNGAQFDGSGNLTKKYTINTVNNTYTRDSTVQMGFRVQYCDSPAEYSNFYSLNGTARSIYREGYDVGYDYGYDDGKASVPSPSYALSGVSIKTNPAGSETEWRKGYTYQKITMISSVPNTYRCITFKVGGRNFMIYFS